MDTECSVVAVYADGATIGSSRSVHGGAWAIRWVRAGEIAVHEASGLLLPTSAWPTITNNYAEYVAAVRALMGLPDGWEGTLYSDSQITLGRLFKGWATQGLPTKLVAVGNAEVRRLRANHVLLSGHPTKQELAAGIGRGGRPVSQHNVWCDAECLLLMEAYCRLHGISTAILVPHGTELVRLSLTERSEVVEPDRRRSATSAGG